MEKPQQLPAKMFHILVIVLSFAVFPLPLSSQSPANPYELVVRKSKFRLDVMIGDSLIKTLPIALGKNPGDKIKRGDNRTPEGKFTIVQIQKSGSWVHDFRDGKGEIAGAYGPWFLRLGSGETRMKWMGIGIHGTHDPTSIGTLVSEGCIRIRNEQLEELRKLVKVGTPVTIIP